PHAQPPSRATFIVSSSSGLRHEPDRIQQWEDAGVAAPFVLIHGGDSASGLPGCARRVRALACTGAVLALAVPAMGSGDRGETFAQAGRRAEAALLGTWYAGGGLWRTCSASGCRSLNRDWGVDSLTYT